VATFVDGPVRVSVPATSANLGPGFDSLGLALSLRDELEAEVLGEGLVVEVEGAGADGVPRDETHLVVRAMRAAFDLMGEQPPGLRQNQRLSARIVLDTRRNVMMVERGSFLEQGGGFAYVIDGSRAVRRPIQTGASSLGAVEIVSGVQPGEKIIVSGSDQFGDAERVTIH